MVENTLGGAGISGALKKSDSRETNEAEAVSDVSEDEAGEYNAAEDFRQVGL